jgi:hypothetical protein
MEFLARNSRTLNTSCAGALSWWRIRPESGSLQSVALFPYSYSILLLLLSHLLFDLITPRFVLCPHLHLSFAFLAAHFMGHPAHLLALHWTACSIQKHSISS